MTYSSEGVEGVLWTASLPSPPSSLPAPLPGDSQREQSPLCPSRGGSRLSWDIRLFDYVPQREVGSIHPSFFLYLPSHHSDGYAKCLFILVLWPHNVPVAGTCQTLLLLSLLVTVLIVPSLWPLSTVMQWRTCKGFRNPFEFLQLARK